MKKVALSLVLLAITPVFAQTTASQDMKDAGHDTVQATKKAAHKKLSTRDRELDETIDTLARTLIGDGHAVENPFAAFGESLERVR